MVVAAEGCARHDGDVRLFEQAFGEAGRAFGLAARVGAEAGGDVRERRRRRRPAAGSGIRAASSGAGRRRRAAPRTRRSSLRRPARHASSAARAPTIANEVAFEVAWLWIVAAASTSSLRPEQVAEPPAGHGVGLRERADHDDGLGKAGRERGRRERLLRRRRRSARRSRRRSPARRARRSLRRSRPVAAGEITPPVGLHGELTITARVRGVIAASIALGVDGEAVGARSRDFDDRGAGEAHLLGDAHPGRRVHDDLLPLLEERQGELEERPLAADRDQRLVGASRARRSCRA